MSRAEYLHEGRYDLPFRAFVGGKPAKCRKVCEILDYKKHVAILALTSVGVCRNEAVRAVASYAVGALRGPLASFDSWFQRKTVADDILFTTFPDNCQYVIWSRCKQLKTSVVPIVIDWPSHIQHFSDRFPTKITFKHYRRQVSPDGKSTYELINKGDEQ